MAAPLERCHTARRSARRMAASAASVTVYVQRYYWASQLQFGSDTAISYLTFPCLLCVCLQNLPIASSKLHFRTLSAFLFYSAGSRWRQCHSRMATDAGWFSIVSPIRSGWKFIWSWFLIWSSKVTRKLPESYPKVIRNSFETCENLLVNQNSTETRLQTTSISIEVIEQHIKFSVNKPFEVASKVYNWSLCWSLQLKSTILQLQPTTKVTTKVYNQKSISNLSTLEYMPRSPFCAQNSTKQKASLSN